MFYDDLEAAHHDRRLVVKAPVADPLPVLAVVPPTGSRPGGSRVVPGSSYGTAGSKRSGALIGKVCDPCVACDDEQVDDSLPPGDAVGSDEITAPFMKPFWQGVGRGAVLAGAGHDAFDPT